MEQMAQMTFVEIGDFFHNLSRGEPFFIFFDDGKFIADQRVPIKGLFDTRYWFPLVGGERIGRLCGKWLFFIPDGNNGFKKIRQIIAVRKK